MSFKYNGQCMGRSLAIEVGKLLDAAEIPHVLYFGLVMAVFGVTDLCDADTKTLGFVVPDELMNCAIRVLKDAGFSATESASECDIESSICCLDQWAFLLPFYWFHLEASDHETGDIVQHAELGLFRKSEWLWDLPAIPLGTPAQDDPNYMLVNDPRLPETGWSESREVPSGRFEERDYRLKTMTPRCFIETLMLLMVRDWETETRGYHWDDILSQFMETCTKLGDVDIDPPRPTELRPGLRNWYTQHYLVPSMGTDKQERHYILQMRQRLLEKGTLPDPPYPWPLPEFWDDDETNI